MLRLNRDRSSLLLALFLFLGVLAPSGSVLWFMNDAARSQTEAARQRETEAYRGQLRLLRSRVDDSWKARAAALDDAQEFVPALRAAQADAVFLPNHPRQPSLPSSREPDPTLDRNDWQQAAAIESERRFEEAAAAWGALATPERNPDLAARAAQAEIRCLLRAGSREAALAAIRRHFLPRASMRAHDLDGRLIAADEQLLAVQLVKPEDARSAAAESLAAILNDYRTPMPSSQRLFLMGELRARVPSAVLPTYDAERLAQQLLETGPPRPGGATLEPAALPGIWKLTSPDQKVLAFYRSATVQSLTQNLLREQDPSRSVAFSVIPPGAPISDEAIAAGPTLPGWQLSFTLLDRGPLEEAAQQRRAAYVWLASAVVLATVLIGAFAGQFFRRQARLNRLKTDLLAAVSHELRTPLASMRLLVETLLDDDRPDAVKTREYLQLIAGENQRLSRLVENFLTFSRIERNRQRFEFAPAAPAAIVEAAVASMRERLQAPGCRLDVEIAPNLPPLRADHDALTTVLINLLDNAWKYTPAEKKLCLRAGAANGRVTFEVADNGIGIAPREQKRIFRRFYQVDRRLARETGGCGLGLSIVDFIVRAHGGEVAVESRLGAGSTFRVTLPARERSQEAAA